MSVTRPASSAGSSDATSSPSARSAATIISEAFEVETAATRSAVRADWGNASALPANALSMLVPAGRGSSQRLFAAELTRGEQSWELHEREWIAAGGAVELVRDGWRHFDLAPEEPGG